MAQSKQQGDNDENSDEIARSIIAPMVEHAANPHSKPPLPHRPDNRSHHTDPEGASNNSKVTSVKTQNLVFHPDHPEKIYDFSSTSSEGSHHHDADKSGMTTANHDHELPIPKRTLMNNSGHLNNSQNNPNAVNNANGNNSSSGQVISNGVRESSKGGMTREQRKERKRKLEDPNCWPKRYEVQIQARVREGMKMDSAYLTDLPEGSVVAVEEIVDRRARISRPLSGWLSVSSKFGARIILPTNSKYSKIGGKLIFKRPVKNQQPDANGQYPTQGKVTDYDEARNLYKVRYPDNTSQWINIDDKNVEFVSQHRAVKVPKSLDGTAPTFCLQTSQAFFNQFFCKDYPQFQAQSSSTTRHMEISPVAGADPRQFGRYPQGQNRQYPPNYRPPHGAPHNALPHGAYPPGAYPQNGYPAGAYPPGQDPRNRHPHGAHGHPPHGHPAGPMGMHYPNGVNPNHPSRPAPQPPSANGVTDPKDINGSQSAMHNAGPEFEKKVKEIERRIIQHLHQRGYTEDHPDYHRYLQKAKELAIQKAGKEGSRKAQKSLTRNQAPMTQKEKELRAQHDAHEAQHRQKRLQKEAAEREAANQARKDGKSPQKTGSAVKGLIVLRGLPGSGKTTLAKKLSQRSKHAQICTEDRYHWSGKEDGVGEYKFQPQLVFLAREWCTKEIREAIDQNVNLIILDNHNARISMYEDHIQYAVEHGYRFRIIEFVASHKLIDKYRARSYKKFPREVYVKLLKLWEHDPRTELINPTFGDKSQETASGATQEAQQQQQ